MSTIEKNDNINDSTSKNMILNENNLNISEELKSDYKEKDNSNEILSNENVNQQIDKFNENNPQLNLENKNINENILLQTDNKKQLESLNVEGDNKKNNNLNNSLNKNNLLVKGKFMQINPHINLLNNHINVLRDNIYDNTKKVLTLKSSLIDSKNFIKENSNSVIMDIVKKLYDFRKAMANENVGVKEQLNEVEKQFNLQMKLHQKLKYEVNKCENKINHLENIIGSHLLENPNYDFMKKIKKNEKIKNDLLTHN